MEFSAEKVRQLRQQRGWSQEHLASVAGLSARTVQRLEADGRGSGESCMAIAAAFDVAVDQLVGDPPAPVAKGSDPLTIVLTLTLLLMLMLAGGYQVGKDLAVRDNARAAGVH
ncbi:helix-turn-helix domain-containing protein [Bacillus subtilis subsp. subtilis]|nr:helix-turn-helix domain-containing protein [Bacillus subtilis subsp. subtilis]